MSFRVIHQTDYFAQLSMLKRSHCVVRSKLERASYLNARTQEAAELSAYPSACKEGGP
jgi:hypothetical protein